MTTTISIETHAHPVEIETQQQHSHADATVRRHGWSNTTEFMGKGERRVVHVSDTTTVTIRELPADATGLYMGEPIAVGESAGANTF